MKFYPNRAQWVVIWGAALLSARAWLYLGPRNQHWSTQHGDRLTEVIAVFGLLLAWQVGGINFSPLAKRTKILFQARTIGVAIAAALIAAASVWLTIPKRPATIPAIVPGDFSEFMKSREKPPETLPADFFKKPPPARQ